MGLRAHDDFGGFADFTDSLEGFVHFENGFSENFHTFAEASINNEEWAASAGLKVVW